MTRIITPDQSNRGAALAHQGVEQLLSGLLALQTGAPNERLASTLAGAAAGLFAFAVTAAGDGADPRDVAGVIIECLTIYAEQVAEAEALEPAAAPAGVTVQ